MQVMDILAITKPFLKKAAPYVAGIAVGATAVVVAGSGKANAGIINDFERAPITDTITYNSNSITDNKTTINPTATGNFQLDKTIYTKRLTFDISSLMNLNPDNIKSVKVRAYTSIINLDDIDDFSPSEYASFSTSLIDERGHTIYTNYTRLLAPEDGINQTWQNADQPKWYSVDYTDVFSQLQSKGPNFQLDFTEWDDYKISEFNNTLCSQYAPQLIVETYDTPEPTTIGLLWLSAAAAAAARRRRPEVK